MNFQLHSGMMKIGELFRQTSSALLNQDMQSQDMQREIFHVEDTDRARLAFNEYLSLILIHHSAFQARYTVHFMMKDAIQLLIKAGKMSDKDIYSSNYAAKFTPALDYIKEYCNILAGNIANNLAFYGIETIHTLPFALEGYHDVFFPLNDRQTFCDAFLITSDFCTLGISLDISISDVAAIDDIAKLDIDMTHQRQTKGSLKLL